MLHSRSLVLSIVVAAACGTGVDTEALRDAAQSFGTGTVIAREGGIWRGFTEVPDLFSDEIQLYPSQRALAVAVDLADEFPVVSNLSRTGWRERTKTDLGLVAELGVGATVWAVTRSGSTLHVERSVTEEIDSDEANIQPADGEPDLSVPLGVLATRFIASEEALVALEPSSGNVAIVTAERKANVLLGRTTLGKLCAVEDVAGVLLFTGSANEDAAGCDELWSAEDEVAPVLGGLANNLAGVGFANGLPLVLRNPPDPCRDDCNLEAALVGPDGTELRSLPSTELSPRKHVAIGEVDGVAFAFGGESSISTSDRKVGSFEFLGKEAFEVTSPGVATRQLTDGAFFADGSWEEMLPFPMGRPRITEPHSVTVTKNALLVGNRNSLGYWKPEGVGRSWGLGDFYINPLYVATESSCLNVRARPSITANVVKCMDTGSEFWSDGNHFTADDEKWISIIVPGSGIRGWAAERYLSGVSPEEPAEFYCGAP